MLLFNLNHQIVNDAYILDMHSKIIWSMQKKITSIINGTCPHEWEITNKNQWPRELRSGSLFFVFFSSKFGYSQLNIKCEKKNFSGFFSFFVFQKIDGSCLIVYSTTLETLPSWMFHSLFFPSSFPWHADAYGFVHICKSTSKDHVSCLKL